MLKQFHSVEKEGIRREKPLPLDVSRTDQGQPNQVRDEVPTTHIQQKQGKPSYE